MVIKDAVVSFSRGIRLGLPLNVCLKGDASGGNVELDLGDGLHVLKHFGITEN